MNPEHCGQLGGSLDVARRVKQAEDFLPIFALPCHAFRNLRGGRIILRRGVSQIPRLRRLYKLLHKKIRRLDGRLMIEFAPNAGVGRSAMNRR
jgi:hypothetical protein